MFVVLFVALAKAQSCSSCSTDPDCASCLQSSDIPHTFFLGTPGVKYTCVLGQCQLNTTSVLPSVALQCNLPSSPCCMPTNNATADTALCQRKRCKNSLGCDKRGFCDYGNTDVYEKCCSVASDCPVVTNVVSPTPLQQACLTPTCSANNCSYVVPSGCCNVASDCPAVADPRSQICAPNLNVPGKKLCVSVLDASGSCSLDSQCGGMQSCFVGTCTSTCLTVPKNPGNPASGCCPSASNLDFCGGDTCRVPVGCNDQPFFHAPEALSELPSFTCIFDNKATRGCCVQDSQCATLNARSGCISADCNTDENRCFVTENSVAGVPCCYSSDMCGVARPDDMCKFYTCSGPPSDLVPSADAFKCVQNTVVSCPLSPPANGLVPAVTQLPTTFDCTWACSDPDFNTIDTTIAFSNPSANGRPVYGFDVLLTITNAANRNVVLSTVLVTKPTSNNPERLVAANAFAASTPVTTPVGTYAITFVSQDYFYVAPGEVITFKFRTVFVGDAAVSGLIFGAMFKPYEPCTTYYVGQPNCTAGDTLLEPRRRLARNPIVFSTATAVFGANPCSAQCFNAVPTPAPPPGATTTPAPSTATIAAPTPAPVTLPISGAVAPDREVLVQVLDCRYSCDANDTTLNRFKFRFTETNTFPIGITSAIKYEFTLNLGPVTFQSISPAGTVFDFFVNEGVPDVLQTNFASIVGNTITFQPTPLNIATSKSQAFSFSFFRSKNSVGTLVTSGSLDWKAYLPPFTCNEIAIIRGLCLQAQLGQTIAPIMSDTLNLEFGNDPDQCSQDACPVRPFISFAASFRYGDIDCSWNCADDNDIANRNRYSVERCFTNNNLLGSGEFGIANFRVRTIIDTPFEQLGPGSLLEVQAFVPGYGTIPATFDSLFGAWAVDIPGAAPVAPQQELCFKFQFIRNPFLVNPRPITLGYTIISNAQCSMPDLESGQCISQNAGLPAANGSYIPLIEADFGSLKLAACDESCDAGTSRLGFIGGRVFFDRNGDGSVNSNDTFLSGIQVEVVRSAALTTVTSTTTDIGGYYFFNESAIFQTANFVFFRIVPSSIPSGLEVTIPGTLNEFWDNVFFGSPPRSEDVVQFGTATLRLAGLRSKPPCQRNFTGPFDPVGKSRIAVAATTCTTCLTGPSQPSLSCTPARCNGAAVHRILLVNYTLSNLDTVSLTASTVRIEFQQALANLDDAQLLCADIRAESVGTGVFANSAAAAVLSGAGARPARADFSWTTWPVGANSLQFGLRIAFCASNTDFLYNITATIKNNACGALIQGWSSCAAGKADDDYRACYNELAPSSLPACPATCTPTAVPTPVPGAPTPAPTFGPPGQSTPINTDINKFEEDDVCVTNTFIRTQPCDDIAGAIANCTVAAVRNVVFFRYELGLKALATSGESGTATIVLQRNMPRSTAFCRRFNPEIRLTVAKNSIVVNNTAAIVTSSVVDQSLQRVKLKLGFLKFNASTVVYLDVRILECLAAPTPFNYTASIQISSVGCRDATACTKTKQFTSNSPDIPCEAAVDEPAFADPNGGGTHITEQFEYFEGEGSTTSDAGVTAIVISILLGVVLCCVCCIFCVPLVLRRFRVQSTTRQKAPSAAPAKNVEFEEMRNRLPSGVRRSARSQQ